MKIIFIYFALSVLYVFIFSVASLFRNRFTYKPATLLRKFLVLIPAYKEDKVVFNPVNSMTNQDYPAHKMHVCVISDSMNPETNERLKEFGIEVLECESPLGTKAKALQYGITHSLATDCEIVLILDADNSAGKDLLRKINDAFDGGEKAVQVHRTASETDTPMALLDAASEEINNSIFRKGHTNMGLSSALIGSGMAFDYNWFANNVTKIKSAGEDKELELLLLKERIFIEYLDNVTVFDEKIKGEKAFYNQRRRWIASQISILGVSLKELPSALLSLNHDLLDKIVQWMILPRVMLLGFLILASLAGLLFLPDYPFGWPILLFVLLLSFAIALPDKFITRRNFLAVKKLPLIFLMMVANLFRIKGAGSKFIHTKKGE